MATTIDGPLPDLTLEQQSILVINAGDPGAKITGVVIHVSQQIPELPVTVPGIAPLFTYGPETTLGPGPVPE